MNTNSVLRQDDYDEFLIVLYFGMKGTYMERCITRAYGDFHRTLTGIGKWQAKKELDAEAWQCLQNSFDEIQVQNTSIASHSDFDAWHKRTCDKLIASYSNYGYHKFCVGHAQKWINMTFKYIFTMGSQRLAGFEDIYQYCHVPIDRIVIEQSQKYGFPVFSTVWSQIMDYEHYLERQNWFRDTFTIPPLDIEFFLWQKSEAITANYLK